MRRKCPHHDSETIVNSKGTEAARYRYLSPGNASPNALANNTRVSCPRRSKHCHTWSGEASRTIMLTPVPSTLTLPCCDNATSSMTASLRSNRRMSASSSKRSSNASSNASLPTWTSPAPNHAATRSRPREGRFVNSPRLLCQRARTMNATDFEVRFRREGREP